MFETSKMRIRVAGRDLFPDLQPGSVFRVDKRSELLPDDSADEGSIIFNTWRGWSHSSPETIDQPLLDELVRRSDQLFRYLTCDDEAQVEWIKQWIAWTIQHPGIKQQIAWVCIGGQGTGKSFMGNTYLRSIFGSLWGTASPSIIDNKFNVGPFIDKMLVFVDEAKFHNESGTDEVKKLIRSVQVPGMEKFGEGRTYNIYSRLYFASNRYDMNIGQSSVIDRALFYTKAYDHKFLNMTDMAFRRWADTLKPWFEEFDALLKRRDVQDHLFHYYLNYPCDKHTIESIKHSASLDQELVAANMRPSRRIAKMIIEEGRVHEDLAIEYFFNLTNLGARIEAISSALHIRPVRTDLVLAEWTEADLIERGRNGMWFKYRHATLVDKFGEAIGSPLDVSWDFQPEDYGDNDLSVKRRSWRGARPGVVQGGGAF
jgi:hypothetical protein